MASLPALTLGFARRATAYKRPDLLFHNQKRLRALASNGAGLQMIFASIYDKLEHTIMPMFYRDQARFIDIMRHAIALNGSFFTAERMVYEYMLKAWGLNPGDLT